jgi:PH (Pleckstrin Homology) domain-containing protein
MATVNQVFQSAPMGRRVIASAILAFAIPFAAVAACALVAAKQMPRRAPVAAKAAATLAPLAALLVVAPIYLFERSKVSQFRIEMNCLVLGSKRFPLEGLVEVRRDPEIMRRAIKTFGNGGLGAIRGRFRSKRIGKFYAFMTGTENAVVLRWPDKVVAVSPADPEFFIYSARSAAGIG